MTATTTAGVCTPWVSPDALTCQAADFDQRVQACQLASDVLYVLSGSHWPGLCDRVARPRVVCGRGCASCWMVGGYPAMSDPFAFGGGTLGGYGRWVSTSGCPASHDQTGPARLRLPGPVAEITKITFDGAILAPTSYALQGSTVVRFDGEMWPTGNDLSREASTANPGSADPAWQVEFVWGAVPPDSGVAVCEVLACEIVAAFKGDDNCRLVWGAMLQSVNRRGVQMTFESLASAMTDGLTGVNEVDLWLVAARGGPWRPRKPRVVRADAALRRGTVT